MNSTTKSVIALQGMTTGTDAWTELFGEVYMDLYSGMTKCVESFRTGLRGDIQEGLSVANEVLLVAIQKFSYKGYEFSSFFSRVLKNKLTDTVRHYNSDKMRPYFENSLDRKRRTDEFDYMDNDKLPTDASLLTTDSYHIFEGVTVSDVLADYHQITEDAKVIEIVFEYTLGQYGKSDMTTKLANHFGSDTYTPAIQRRVSRIRANFRRFAQDSGLSV